MRDMVESYFRAMQRGPGGVDDLMRLFASDAVYVEPFAGAPREHRGMDAIRTYLDGSQRQAPPDMKLTVDRIDVDGPRVSAEWTCESPAFPRPARGRDEFTIADGRIQRLETTLTEAPE